MAEIHSVRIGEDSHEPYEESLENPGEAFRAPCGEQAIIYTTLGAAAFVCSIVRSHALGLPFTRHLAFDFGNFFIETGARG